jgi:hypothetical protein
MFKSIFVIVVSLTSLALASAANKQFGYECAAGDKKIIAHYSYVDNGSYVLDSLTIDGQDYKFDTRLSVSRGSANFSIKNYRNGKTLMLKMGIENSYQLGNGGTIYQMLCYPTRSPRSPRSPAKDDQI